MDIPHYIVTHHHGSYYIYRRANAVETYSEFCKVTGGYEDARMLMSALNYRAHLDIPVNN